MNDEEKQDLCDLLEACEGLMALLTGATVSNATELRRWVHYGERAPCMDKAAAIITKVKKKTHSGTEGSAR